MQCYERFGWTPGACREVLSRDPLEAHLLGIYFSELGAKMAQQQRDAERQARHQQQSSGSDGFVTDSVIGDDDELDED